MKRRILSMVQLRAAKLLAKGGVLRRSRPARVFTLDDYRRKRKAAAPAARALPAPKKKRRKRKAPAAAAQPIKRRRKRRKAPAPEVQAAPRRKRKKAKKRRKTTRAASPRRVSVEVINPGRPSVPWGARTLNARSQSRARRDPDAGGFPLLGGPGPRPRLPGGGGYLALPAPSGDEGSAPIILMRPSGPPPPFRLTNPGPMKTRPQPPQRKKKRRGGR